MAAGVVKLIVSLSLILILSKDETLKDDQTLKDDETLKDDQTLKDDDTFKDEPHLLDGYVPLHARAIMCVGAPHVCWICASLVLERVDLTAAESEQSRLDAMHDDHTRALACFSVERMLHADYV
eukprot:378848-Rhodomonas_salina.5